MLLYIHCLLFPVLVLHIRTYLPTYLQVLDQALAIARELRIRLIIPFVDQWQWVGGIESYARFRGHTEALVEKFWNDDVIRRDFQVGR